MHLRRTMFALALAPSLAAGVQPRFDLSIPPGGPFPSDVFTVPDAAQNTALRITLPKPADCVRDRSDCEDMDLLNELDGFQRSPRISIPFDGAIDPATVTGDTVFLVGLGNTLPGGEPAGAVIRIDVMVWDALANTLHFEPSSLLDEHARYAVVVTRDVRDAQGERIERSEGFHRFARQPRGHGAAAIPGQDAYRRSLLEALAVAERAGVKESKVAVMSVFTTLSSSATLLKLRDHVRSLPTPAPARFDLGQGDTRSVFSLDHIKALTFNRQIGAALSPLGLADRLVALRILPGVGRIAFGSFLAPSYVSEVPPYTGTIPPLSSRTGTPTKSRDLTLYVNVYLPSGEMPANGWPVVIFGYGGADNKQFGPHGVAAAMANLGLATVAMDLPSNGFGELSTMTVSLVDGTSATVAAGGRASEPAQAPPPRSTLLSRDRLIQGAIDVVHLVRVLDAGVDVDGDGARDLDASRIYAFGFSAGGGSLLMAMAIEPRIRAGVFNSSASGAGDGLGLSPNARSATGTFLGNRTPSLLNSPPAEGLTQIGDGQPLPYGPVCVRAPLFNETQILPGRTTITSAVPGAMDIQALFDRARWLGQPGSTTAMLPLLRRRPLPDVPIRPVILQYSKGDQNVVNAAAMGAIAAGGLADHTTFLRYDIAYARSGGTLPENPHNVSQLNAPTDERRRDLALALQLQAATFLASDGTRVEDPDGDDTVFEVPIADPHRDGLSFIAHPCSP